MSTENSMSSRSSSSASPPNCEFGIKLRMELSQHSSQGDAENPVTPVRPQAWRLRITVVEVNNIDPNVFVYNLGEVDPQTGNSQKVFQCVASPVDLVEYPVAAPATDHPSFFRLASVDCLHRNFAILEAFWTDLCRDVQELIDTCARLCELETHEDFTAGTLVAPEPAPEPEPGSSDEPPASSDAPNAPDDAVTELVIAYGRDPDFPPGLVLSESAPQGDAPDYERTWEAVGVLSGNTLRLITSLMTHVISLQIFTGEEQAVTWSGLSNDYKAILGYHYADGREYQITIAAG